jgi:coenzyme F420 hydrogenase subunit beta
LDVNKIRRMDIPPPPSATMILETDDGQVEVPLSEVKALIPHTCFICPDMTSELADLSVGMYEGRPGWNTLIVRSEDGAHIVEKAQAEGFLETAVFPEENLMHLSKAAADKKERSLRTLDRRGLINTGKGRHAALRIPPEVVKRILGKF